MREYLELLSHIENHGVVRTNERTGTGTKAIFGYQMRFNLSEGFPLLTTKKMFWRGIITELLWMISGSRNIRPLVLSGVKIWNEWPFQKWLDRDLANRLKYPKYSDKWHRMQKYFIQKIADDPEFAEEYGDLGAVYGYQWRHWKHEDSFEVDQLADAVWKIQNTPDDRRIIVTAWNPAEVERVALPPCHLLFQFFVGNGKLSCQMYQRSVDTFLGLPFNIASYAALTMMIARICRLTPGELILCLGDTHLYLTHEEQVREHLTRIPRELPKLVINPAVSNINLFKPEDFTLVGYDPYPAIPAPISV